MYIREGPEVAWREGTPANKLRCRIERAAEGVKAAKTQNGSDASELKDQLELEVHSKAARTMRGSLLGTMVIGRTGHNVWER